MRSPDGSGGLGAPQPVRKSEVSARAQQICRGDFIVNSWEVGLEECRHWFGRRLHWEPGGVQPEALETMRFQKSARLSLQACWLPLARPWRRKRSARPALLPPPATASRSPLRAWRLAGPWSLPRLTRTLQRGKLRPVQRTAQPVRFVVLPRLRSCARVFLPAFPVE